MSPIQKGLLFAGIGAAVDLVCGLILFRPLLHMSWGATAGMTVAFVVFGAVYGLLTGRKEIYSIGPRPIWSFILDVSWSSLNTVTGLFWMIWCAAKGTFQPPEEKTQKRGILVFSGAALPGADATTIGNVMGGEWLLHETVHVQQARIFGPFYWPIYLLSYLTNLISRAITGRIHDLHWEAYGRVVMEDWAYHAAPHANAESVEVAPTVMWLGLALINCFAVAVPLGYVGRRSKLTAGGV